jgi:hypothetical protein
MISPKFRLMAMAALALPMWAAESKSLFDGKTLQGWEGDPKIWSVQDGAITAGSIDQRAKRNEFLASTRSYTNFVLRLQFKIEGTEGFVNSGVQIRSERIPNHHEMVGYQADIGEGWYGALYDESRRNTILAKPVSRFEYLLGKLSGVFLLLTLSKCTVVERHSLNKKVNHIFNSVF